MKPINYYSETDKDFIKEIRGVKTLEELISVTKDYREIFPDAFETTMKMSEKDFKRFLKGLPLTVNDNTSEAWVEEFGPVLMPINLIRIGLMAVRFHVPFGAAYIREKEINTLETSE
jgi:hypothetical protein